MTATGLMGGDTVRVWIITSSTYIGKDENWRHLNFQDKIIIVTLSNIVNNAGEFLDYTLKNILDFNDL